MAFNLTAQLNLQGPTNVKQIAAQIKKDLGNINANITFKLDPAVTKNVAALSSSLKGLNAAFGSTTTSATAASAAIKAFGNSINSVKINNVPQQINAAANAVNKLNKASASSAKDLGSASAEMQEFGKQAGLAIRRFVAFSTVTSVIYGLTNSISQGVQAFIDYDKELVKLQQVTGESSSGLAKLQEQITNLSTTFGVSSKDLTSVASTLAQAGLSARETEKALRALALSSLAPSFDNMNETVEGSIALMRQFGISADDLEGALGAVNTVAARFAVESSDIITAVQRTGSVFATASKGVSEGKDALNEFIAVFTSVRATTRESAETIATGLRTIFTRIQRGSTIDSLKEFGVNLTDTEGKFVGAYKAVELLSKGLSGIDPRTAQFSKIVEELGGFRQIGKVIPLIQQFTVAQEALKTAQAGQGSLAKDAATAQLSLANQISKVRQEFFALFREIGQSKGFQSLIRGALSLASGLIKVTDAVKGILPALAVITAFKGAKALTQFASGFSTGVKRGPDGKANGGVIRKFARGGVVPGTGSGDTVPAMLEPGEFVIRKKAVETIGSDNLHNMNKYGGGGSIRAGGSNRRKGFASGGAVEIRSLESIKKVKDGDSFIATAIPRPKPFEVEFRVGGFDAYETMGERSNSKKTGESKVTQAKLDQISQYEKNANILNKVKKAGKKSNDWVIPPETIVTDSGLTAVEAGNKATEELKKNLNNADEGKLKQLKKQIVQGNKDRYNRLLIEGDSNILTISDEFKTGRTFGYNSGGRVQKFMVGGKAKETRSFGSGGFPFPKRISNAYFKEIDAKLNKEQVDKAFSGGSFLEYPEDFRFKVDQAKATESFDSMPFDRKQFADSFKSKLANSAIYRRMTDFAKFIGLPKEDLSLALPSHIDFTDLGLKGLGQFDRTGMGTKSTSGYNLSGSGYTEANDQDLYGYEKLVAEKQKELKKIIKTPVKTFDDGSFSYDEALAKQTWDEINDLQMKISNTKKLKNQAELTAMDQMQTTAKATGRGAITMSTGRLSGRKNDTFYHEMTHQLFQGLRTRSAESFDKYKSRVVSLFSGDNNDLADAFDALESSYNSSDVVYGRSYKVGTLDQIIQQNRSISRGDKPAKTPEAAAAASSLWAKSLGIKKAKDFKPLNPEVNQALLDNSISQSYIDRIEDSGKEEFLTTLVQNSPRLDSNLQGALDSTLTDLLGSAGIKRQTYAAGGKVQRNIGIIDTDVLRDPANADIVGPAMEKLGITNTSLYSRELAQLAVQARKEESLSKLTAIAGAAGSGKSSLATGKGSPDDATLRKTIRSSILSPEDIAKVNEVIVLTSTASQEKLDAYLKDVDRAYILSSNTIEEQDQIGANRTQRDLTGEGLYGRKPGITNIAPRDFTVEESILRDELGKRATVLGRKPGGFGLRRKTEEELPEIVQAGGYYTGGFAPPTRGHRGAFDTLLSNMISRNPNASAEDIIVSVAPNLSMDRGEGDTDAEKLAHAARYGIFPADFRALLAGVNFPKGMISAESTGRGDVLPKMMEVQGANGRRKFAKLKGALAITSGKKAGALQKYEKAGVDVTDIPRIDDISATKVRQAVINGDDEALTSFVSPEVASVLMGNRAQLRNRSVMVPMLIEEITKYGANQKAQTNAEIQKMLAEAPGGPYGKNITQKVRDNAPDVVAQIEAMREKRDELSSSLLGYRAHNIISLLSAKYPDAYGLDPSRRASVSAQPSDLSKDVISAQLSEGMAGEFSGVPIAMPSGLQEAILKNVEKATQVKKSSGILPAQGTEILKRFGTDRLPNDASFGPFSGKTVRDTAEGGKLKYWNSAFRPETKADKLAYYIATRDYLIDKFNESQGTQKATSLAETTSAVLSSKQLGLVGLNPLGYTGLLGPETWNLGVDSSGQERSIDASIVQRGLPNQYQNVIDYLSGQTEEIVGGASKLLGIEPKKLTKKQRETLGQGNIEGALLEQIFGSADATILDDALRTRPIDFPMGIGPKAAKIFGIDPDIPTEVKRTIDSNSRGKAVEEFQKHFRQQYGIPEPVKEDIQMLSDGGWVRGSYSPPDIAARAKTLGMSQEELTAKLEERLDNRYKDYAIPDWEINKRFGLIPSKKTSPEQERYELAQANKQKRIQEAMEKQGRKPKEFETKTNDEKMWRKNRGYATGGQVKLYHGSNTGVDDSVLKSFKEKGALSDIAKGYGQGAGFYLYTEKNKAEQQAKMRVNGGSNFTVAQGDRSGKPMVLSFDETLDPKTYDLDYELQKGLVVQWMHDNYDALKDKYAPTENQTGLKGKFDKNPDAGMMSVGVRVQEGSQTLKSEDGTEFTLPGGSRKSIYAGSEGDVREGALLGQLMSRIQSGDPELVNSFESKLFEKPLGLALKYVGSSPLKPTNIETFAKGGQAGISSKDTVPALLTPGEFVVNKKAAEKIGYGKLETLNKADKIQGYNKGGVVGGGVIQRFATGGSVFSIEAIMQGLKGLAEPAVQKLKTRPETIDSKSIEASSELLSNIKLLTEGFEEAGYSMISFKKILEQVGAGADISYKDIERAMTKDVERLKITGASIDTIIAAEKALKTVRDQAKTAVVKRQFLEAGLKESKTGKVLGSGGAQQAILTEAEKKEKLITAQRKSQIEKDLIKKDPSLLGDKDKLERRTNRRLEKEQRQIKEQAFTSATEKVTGIKRSELSGMGIGGADIQSYVSQSMTDRKTLAQMDKQLIAMRLEEYKNAGTVRGVSVKSASEALSLAKEEVSKRREMINEMAAEQGEKGVGAAGLTDIRNSPIKKAVQERYFSGTMYQGIGTALGDVGMAAGLVGGQGKNIANMMYDTSTDEGKIAAAGRGAAIEQAGSTLATGLTTASQLMAINPMLGAAVAIGTALYAASDAVFDFTGAQKTAALEMEKNLRFEEVAASEKDLAKAFKDFEKDLGNIDLQKALDKALVRSSESSLKAVSAETKVAENEKGLTRTWTEFLSGAEKPKMDVQDVNELASKQAERNADSGDKAFALISQKINTGASVESIQADKELIGARRALVLADEDSLKTVRARIVSEGGYDKVSKQRQDAILDEVANEKILTNVQVQSAIKTKQMSDALEAADKAGRKLAASFEKLSNIISESVNRIKFESDVRKSSAEKSRSALRGQSEDNGPKLRELNVLENPNAYSEKDFNDALKSATAGVDEKTRNQLIGGAQLQQQLPNAITKSIADKLSTKGSLGVDEAKAEAIKITNEKIDKTNLSDEQKTSLKKQAETRINNLAEESKKKNDTPQAELDAFREGLGEADNILGAFGIKTLEAVKALSSFKQGALADFSEGLKDASKAAKDAQNYFKKARDIRTQGNMNLREVMTGVGETYDEKQARIMGDVAGLAGGQTTVGGIQNRMVDLQGQRKAVEEKRQGMSDPDELKKSAIQLRSLDDQLRDTREALDTLASSTELVEKAFDDLKNVRDLQKNRESFVNTLLTNTPEEADKLNKTFIRLQRNLSGGLNGASNQRDARKAFNQTLRETGSVREATKAGNTVLANQRKETLALSQDPGVRAAQELNIRNKYAQGKGKPGVSADQAVADYFKQQQLQLTKSMAIESGMMNNPLVQQSIAAMENPNADPAMKEASSKYLQSVGLQADATKAQGELALLESQQALVSANVNLKVSIDDLRATIEANMVNNDMNEGRVGVAGGKMVNPGIAVAAPVAARARGGVIYASEGQLVNFQPQGTDTVPAMLTPGEFVINAKSTAEHLPLLKAINSGYYSKGGVVYLQKGGKAQDRKQPTTDGAIEAAKENQIPFEIGRYRRGGDNVPDSMPMMPMPGGDPSPSPTYTLGNLGLNGDVTRGEVGRTTMEYRPSANERLPSPTTTEYRPSANERLPEADKYLATTDSIATRGDTKPDMSYTTSVIQPSAPVPLVKMDTIPYGRGVALKVRPDEQMVEERRNKIKDRNARMALNAIPPEKRTPDQQSRLDALMETQPNREEGRLRSIGRDKRTKEENETYEALREERLARTSTVSPAARAAYAKVDERSMARARSEAGLPQPGQYLKPSRVPRRKEDIDPSNRLHVLWAKGKANRSESEQNEYNGLLKGDTSSSIASNPATEQRKVAETAATERKMAEDQTTATNQPVGGKPFTIDPATASRINEGYSRPSNEQQAAEENAVIESGFTQQYTANKVLQKSEIVNPATQQREEALVNAEEKRTTETDKKVTNVLYKKPNELTDEDLKILDKRFADPTDRGRLKAGILANAGRNLRAAEAQPSAEATSGTGVQNPATEQRLRAETAATERQATQQTEESNTLILKPTAEELSQSRKAALTTNTINQALNKKTPNYSIATPTSGDQTTKTERPTREFMGSSASRQAFNTVANSGGTLAEADAAAKNAIKSQAERSKAVVNTRKDEGKKVVDYYEQRLNEARADNDGDGQPDFSNEEIDKRKRERDSARVNFSGNMNPIGRKPESYYSSRKDAERWADKQYTSAEDYLSAQGARQDYLDRQARIRKENEASVAGVEAGVAHVVNMTEAQYAGAFRSTYGDTAADAIGRATRMDPSVGRNNENTRIKDEEKKTRETFDRAKNYEGPLGNAAYVGDTLTQAIVGALPQDRARNDSQDMKDINARREAYRERERLAGNKDFSFENSTNPIFAGMGSAARSATTMYQGTIGAGLNLAGGVGMNSMAGYADAFGNPLLANEFRRKGDEALTAVGSDVGLLGAQASRVASGQALEQVKTAGEKLDEKNVKEAGSLGFVVRGSQIIRDTAIESALPLPTELGKAKSVARRLEEIDIAAERAYQTSQRLPRATEWVPTPFANRPRSSNPLIGAAQETYDTMTRLDVGDLFRGKLTATEATIPKMAQNYLERLPIASEGTGSMGSLGRLNRGESLSNSLRYAAETEVPLPSLRMRKKSMDMSKLSQAAKPSQPILDPLQETAKSAAKPRITAAEYTRLAEEAKAAKRASKPRVTAEEFMARTKPDVAVLPTKRPLPEVINVTDPVNIRQVQENLANDLADYVTPARRDKFLSEFIDKSTPQSVSVDPTALAEAQKKVAKNIGPVKTPEAMVTSGNKMVFRDPNAKTSVVQHELAHSFQTKTAGMKVDPFGGKKLQLSGLMKKVESFVDDPKGLAAITGGKGYSASQIKKAPYELLSTLMQHMDRVKGNKRAESILKELMKFHGYSKGGLVSYFERGGVAKAINVAKTTISAAKDINNIAGAVQSENIGSDTVSSAFSLAQTLSSNPAVKEFSGVGGNITDIVTGTQTLLSKEESSLSKVKAAGDMAKASLETVGTVASNQYLIPSSSSTLSSIGKTSGQIAGKMAPALAIAGGAMAGLQDEKAIQQGISAPTRAVFGAISGSASSGGSITAKLANQEISQNTDERLAQMESAARGAAIGASAGNVVPVVGPVAGAVVGGSIGFGSESLKVGTEAGSIDIANREQSQRFKQRVNDLAEQGRIPLHYTQSPEYKKAQQQSSDPARYDAATYNSGGLVYANNGALVPSLAQGSDTVPAMLTPGEFVVNRESSQQHMPLLNAINSGHFNRGGIVNYLANGGIVAPKYYANAGPVTGGSSGSSGVSNDISSSISTAVGQAMNQAVGQLSTALQSGMETYSQMMQSSTETLNNFGQTFSSASQTIASSANTWSETASQIPTSLTAEVTGRQVVDFTGLGKEGDRIVSSAAQAGELSGRQTSQNTMAKYDRSQFDGNLNTSANNRPMRT